MRFALAVFFAASTVSALTVLKRQTNLPACAQTCYASTNPSPCDPTDAACQCLSVNYITALATCVASNCSAEDAQTAQAAALATCKAAGVDLTAANPLPACAQTCDQNTKSTSCSNPDDVACSCKDTTYIQSIDSCFKTYCTGQDLTTAETVGKALCRAYGVDISSTVGAA